jgi:hypothetical protein
MTQATQQLCQHSSRNPAAGLQVDNDSDPFIEGETVTKNVRVPKGPFYTSQNEDTNDGKPWDKEELDDLAACLKDGHTIEEAARFLCRSGTVEEVRQKAKELGLSELRK